MLVVTIIRAQSAVFNMLLLSNIPKPKDFSVTVINDKDKQKLLTEEFGTRTFLTFLLENWLAK